MEGSPRAYAEYFRIIRRRRTTELSSNGRREGGDHRIVEGCDLPYAGILDEDAQA